MLTPTRLIQLLKVVGPFVLALWLLGSIISSRTAFDGLARHFQDEKELFVSDFLTHEIDGPFDGHSISELCASKQWTQGLILSCEPPAMGFSQVRNAHLNCIRFAIEMGAELIVPRIVKRELKEITALVHGTWNGGGPVRADPFDHFFDFQFLNQSLSQSCPQMKVYRSIDDLWDVPSIQIPNHISLNSIHARLINTTVVYNTSALSQQIETYVNEMSPPKERTRPVRFHLDVTNWAFPMISSHPELRRHYGRILRIREDLRRLSAVATFNLAKRYQLDLDPRQGLREDSFVGVHLRTEEDAQYTFPRFNEQASNLIDYIAGSGRQVVFVATGATKNDDVTLLAGMAEKFNVTVVRKQDLLEGQDLQLLEDLTWDERALVDYEIMLRAGLMAGPAGSTFSWGVASRRARVAGTEGGGLVTNATGYVQWRDSRSALFGVNSKSLVLRDTVWP